MKIVDIPWGVWHNDTPFSLQFPVRVLIGWLQVLPGPDFQEDILRMESHPDPVRCPRIRLR